MVGIVDRIKIWWLYNSLFNIDSRLLFKSVNHWKSDFIIIHRWPFPLLKLDRRVGFWSLKFAWFEIWIKAKRV
jgi:hypothetical protein